jgi:hypothetical protein
MNPPCTHHLRFDVIERKGSTVNTVIRIALTGKCTTGFDRQVHGGKSRKLVPCSVIPLLALLALTFVSAHSVNAQTLATIITPANGATNVNPNTAFTWNQVSDAQAYYIWIGSQKGMSDVWNSHSMSATLNTATPPANTLHNTTFYYLRMWTEINGSWSNHYVDTTFTTGTAPATLATIITPANGATNVSPSTAFTWNQVSDAQAYYIWIGSQKGLSDVWNSGSINVSLSSITPPVGKLQGNTSYFLRMWTEINGAWTSHYVDTTFTTSAGTAQLIYPANGATNIDPWNPFSWTTVAGATYSINIGSTAGGSDIFSSGQLSVTSMQIPGLKQNTTYFATLFTNTSQGSTSVGTSFTTGLGQAHLINPPNGSTGIDPFQPFAWNSVPGAQWYYIYVGDQPGVTDVYNSGQLATSITSRLVPGLLGAKTYYVRMWTFINNTWFSNTTSFSTAPQPLPSSASSFRSTVQQQTGAVRLMTQGVTNTPIPGTLLATVVAQDGRTTAFCTEYAYTLAEELIGQRISIRLRSMTFDGTPFESHVTTEYWDPFLSEWITADPTFGIVYWDNSTGAGLSVSQIEADVVAQNWSAITPYILYVTNNGEIYSHNYYMDPILNYLNPEGPGIVVAPVPVPNNPAPYMSTQTSTGTAGNWLFSFQNSTDTVTISDPVKGTLTLGPNAKTMYSQAVNLNTGWTITSQPGGMQILQMNRYLYF